MVGLCEGAGSVPGRPTYLIKAGQGPIELALGVGRCCSRLSFLFSFSHSQGDGPI